MNLTSQITSCQAPAGEQLPIFETRTAIANAEQNQQIMNQDKTTRVQQIRESESAASSSTSILVVATQPPTEDPISRTSNLSVEAQRTMTRLTQSQASHQEDQCHNPTRGRNIHRSQQEDMTTVTEELLQSNTTN